MRRLLLLLLLVSLVACKRGTPKDGTVPKTRVQLNWVPEPEFGGLYEARESGAYQRAELDVELVGGAAGTPVVQIVASGQADFGIVGADDVVLARARGVDLVAVFAPFQHSPLGVMVHEEKGYKRLEDLKSGTLAIEPGLPFGAWLKKKYGFASVTLVPYDGGIARFLTDGNHAQQCYVTSEPIAARKQGAKVQVFGAKDTGFDPYANVVVVRGALLKSNMPLVRKFVTATLEGWRGYLKDPSRANAVMAKLNTAMDAETFAAAAKTQEPLVRGELPEDQLGTMTAERFDTLAKQLMEIGITATAPAASDCFVNVR